MRIMVTSAGGPAAIGVIKSLEKYDKLGTSHQIIATDITKNSVGYKIANKGYIVPKSTDKDFIPTIRKIIKKENIELLLPKDKVSEFTSNNNINAQFWLAKDSNHVDAMLKYPNEYADKMELFFNANLK